MADEKNAPEKAPVAIPAPSSIEIDLSAEISATVETQVGEIARCVRIFGDSYRCNWWGHEEASDSGKPIPSGFEITELRVRRSRFLKVRKTREGLQIQDVTFAIPDRARVK